MGQRTVYYTAASLDGYLADERDSLDWLFVHEQDPDGPMGYEAFIAGVGAAVMGATTYRWVVDHLRSSGEPWPYTQPCWVLTHRPLEPVAESVRFAAADDLAALRRVHAAAVEAAAGKDVWLVGGGGPAAALAAAGLVDELQVSLAPVLLGSGKPLLAGRADLRLTRVERNKDFVCCWYDVRPSREPADPDPRP